MENTRDRVENRLRDAIIEGVTLLTNMGLDIEVSHNVRARRYSFTDLVVEYNNINALVAIAKEEEGKDRLCGGKRS